MDVQFTLSGWFDRGTRLVFTDAECSALKQFYGLTIDGNKVTIYGCGRVRADDRPVSWTVTLESCNRRFYCTRDEGGVWCYIYPRPGSTVIYDDDISDPQEYIFAGGMLIPRPIGGYNRRIDRRSIRKEINHRLRSANTGTLRFIAEYLGIEV